MNTENNASTASVDLQKAQNETFTVVSHCNNTIQPTGPPPLNTPTAVGELATLHLQKNRYRELTIRGTIQLSKQKAE